MSASDAPAGEAAAEANPNPSSRQVLDIDPAWLLSTRGAPAHESPNAQVVGRPRSLSEAERASIDDSFISTVGQAVVQIDFQSSRV